MAFRFKATSLLIFLFAAGTAFAEAPSPASKLNAQELIQRIETQHQAETAHAVVHMTIQTSNWTRELRMEMWSEGRENMLARILEPRKDRGIATLKVGDEMWNYLPNIDRVMKIPASLMGDRWMGSNLTNDDIVRDVQIDQVYTFSVAREDSTEALIVATPKPDAAVVWGKIEYDVDLEKELAAAVRYYDEIGELVRTMSFDRVKKVGDRWVAHRMVVKPEDEPESTELVYETLEFGKALPSGVFSLRNLRR